MSRDRESRFLLHVVAFFVFLIAAQVFFLSRFLLVRQPLVESVDEVGEYIDSLPYNASRFYYMVNLYTRDLVNREPPGDSLRFLVQELYRIEGSFQEVAELVASGRVPRSAAEELLLREEAVLVSGLLEDIPRIISEGERLRELELPVYAETLEYLDALNLLASDVRQLMEVETRLSDFQLARIRNHLRDVLSTVDLFLWGILGVILPGAFFMAYSARKIREARLSLTQANRDLTSALERLENARRELMNQRQLAALSRIVAGVAHELNTPLGVMVTAGSSLDELFHSQLSQVDSGRQESKWKEMRALLELQMESLGNAVKIMEVFKSLEVMQDPDPLREIHLGDLARNILAVHSQALLQERVDVELREQGDMQISSHAGAWQQILYQLVDNCIHHAYARDQGVRQMDIIIDRREGRLDLRVQDNGVGMDSHSLDRALEPFFSSVRKPGHYGLGLSLVSLLVSNRLGGEVSLSSGEGEGCGLLVTIHIPLEGLLETSS